MTSGRDEIPHLNLPASGCLLLACWLACAAPVAHAASDRSAYSQWKSLLEAAPNRQIGQPGNDFVDGMVSRRFAEAAGKRNDPKRWAAAEQLLKKAESAKEDFWAAKRRREQMIQRGTVVRSPFWVYYTVESPLLTIAGLVILLAVVLATWRVQRRRRLLVIAFLLALAVIVLPITAAVVTTKTEAAARRQDDESSRTGQHLDAAVKEASVAALRADLQAAKALRGLWQHGRMKFHTAAFTPGPATLAAGEGRIRLYQMAPNLVEPANLPPGGYTGELVYVGEARRQDFSGKDLRDRAVMMDFACHKRWLDVVQLGARVILFVEPADNANRVQAVKKTTVTPLSVPRFYVRRKDLAEAFGQNWRVKTRTALPVRITQPQPGTWQRREVAIDWLLIPPAADSRDRAAPDREGPATELVHLQTYKDSASVVPELSPGANGAANLVLLMRLLDEFEKHPPARPVLLSVVNDHTNALYGEHQYAFYAFMSANAIRKELAWTERELTKQRFYQELYKRKPDAELIVRMRAETATVAGQVLKLKDPILQRIQMLRNKARRRIARIKFHLSRNQEKRDKQESLKEIERLETDVKRMIRLMSLFNRFGRKLDYQQLTSQEREDLEKLFFGLSDRMRLQADELAHDLRQLLSNLSVRRRLLYLTRSDLDVKAIGDLGQDEAFDARYTPLPAVAGIALDLSFGTDRAGFFHSGHLGPGDKSSFWAAPVERVGELLNHALEIAKGTGQGGLLVSTMVTKGGISWIESMGGRFAVGSTAFHWYDRPGITLMGLRDLRSRAYTPHDTAERIDRNHFDRLMGFAEKYLPRLVNSVELGDTLAHKGKSQTHVVRVQLRLHDELATGLPQIVVPNSLVVVLKTGFGVRPLTVAGQVRARPILMTGPRGEVVFRGAAWREGNVVGYAYDETFGNMTAAMDMAMDPNQFPSIISTKRATFAASPMVMFEARKVDLVGLTEPLTLAPVKEVDVLDADEGTRPRSFAVAGVRAAFVPKGVAEALDGTGCVMIKPDRRFILRIGKGVAVATDESGAPEGHGFQAGTGRQDLLVIGANDMRRLADSRLETLFNKGVVSGAAAEFAAAAGDQLERFNQDRRAGRTERLLDEAEEARGVAFRAYTGSLGTVIDLINAVVIFLAMIIPFCFFTMKLITPFADVNRQLGLFGALFVVTAGFLYFVHPAFDIAQTPMVVVLAFVILGLAVFVAGVLMGRFNTSMMQAVEESQQVDSIEAPRGRLAEVAFMVGVNNMKRRRIRTTLTCLTIVLVTFTMLSVISVGHDIDPVRLRVSREAPYNGFVFARPGLAPIDSSQMARLKAHFDRHATAVARIWAQNLGPIGEYLNYELRPVRPIAGARVDALVAKILLGLDVAEQGFVSQMPLMPGGAWFSSNDASEVILSVEMAGLLGITPQNFSGREILIGDRRLKLIGLMDDQRLRELKDLGEVPVLPMVTEISESGYAERREAALRQAQDEASGRATLGAGGGSLISDPNTRPAEPLEVAFVPIGFARSLGDGDYRTLSVKYSQGEGNGAKSAAQQAWDDANRLIRFQHTRLAVGLRDRIVADKDSPPVAAGQYAMASSSSSEVGGVLKIAIPIIIIATIIFNTMLGSVMERKREVSIYNAIGLNPGHVMMFFLAESFVYGIIGSVAGYLIGQALSLVLAQSIGLNLNYSSLSVIFVIFLSIGTVLLSTLYPAAMAARAAVPSGQRKWSIPRPEGDQIHVKFPFSYDAGRVLGACCYLHEFMQQNSEASTGKFLAGIGPVGRVPSDQGARDSREKAYAMVFDIAPAPFDLGVNQKMEVYAGYDPRVSAHMLSVHLTRLSGQRGNWVTVNQPFLEALRKRLLGWRSQSAENQQAYCSKGEQLFADAPDLPTSEPTG